MDAYDSLQQFNRDNPHSKLIYKKMQQWHLKNDNKDGVFCASEQIWRFSPDLAKALIQASINKNYLKDDAVSMAMLQHFWGCHLFGTWRNTLGIYQIDADVLPDVLKSEIPDDTPINIFSRLPEWCVYMQFTGVSLIDGFWALYDYKKHNNKNKLCLNLVPNFNQDNASSKSYQIQPLQIIIEDGLTVKQACQQVFDVTAEMFDDSALLDNDSLFASDYALTKALLSMLLWLCAEQPDISNIKGEPVSSEQLRLPKYRRNKKTGAFIPPDQPIIYNIGKRLGGEIRQFNDKHGTSDSRISSRKRPHIRRGHWHGVWSGTGQDKQFKVYWQPAIFVNAC